MLRFLFCDVAVRSTDSDTVFDDKYESEEEDSTKRWRKRRSMLQTTDSADSLSEPEVSYLPCIIMFLMIAKPVHFLSVLHVQLVCFGLIWSFIFNYFSAVPLCTVAHATARWCICGRSVSIAFYILLWMLADCSLLVVCTS